MTHRTCTHTLVFCPARFDTTQKPIFAIPWHEVPLAPPLGELLSVSEAEGVSCVEWYAPLVSTAPCRGRQLGDPSGEAALAPSLRELAARTG